MLDFDRDGAALMERDITPGDLDQLRSEFTDLDFRAGARPFAASDVVRRLIAKDGCFGRAITKLKLDSARPVRILAFEKTPANNWNLGWHQDRVIAVKEKLPVEGFQNWTVKNGVPHVEAPEALLRHMIFLRLHLDPCPAENGALRTIPGSAELGKLNVAEIKGVTLSSHHKICEAAEGEIHAVRALTLHASSPSINPSHRRVLHIDYCSATLPIPLQWALDWE